MASSRIFAPALFALLAFGGSSATPRRVDGPYAALEKKYEITVDVPTEDVKVACEGYTVLGRAATKEELSAYKPLFLKEWNYYPPALVKRVKLKKIVLLAGVKVDAQLRSAVPSFDTDTLYLDVEAGSKSPLYQRGVIHHEFYHMIDFAMGTLYKDPKWAAINATDFKYGTGGKDMQTGDAGEMKDDLIGFLTPYSTAGVEEDKAEVFSHMFTHAKIVRTRAQSDGVIARKLLLMKAQLYKFEPACDEDKFWPSIPGWD